MPEMSVVIPVPAEMNVVHDDGVAETTMYSPRELLRLNLDLVTEFLFDRRHTAVEARSDPLARIK